MGGAALGRLWDTHPKMAFVLHLLLTVYFGVLAAGGFLSGNAGGGVVLSIGFAVMAGSLVAFTWLAARDNWQPDGTSYDGRGQMVGPRAAWANTRTWGRISWLLFGVAFLAASFLLIARNGAGVALILVAFALALIAMRTD